MAVLRPPADARALAPPRPPPRSRPRGTFAPSPGRDPLHPLLVDPPRLPREQRRHPMVAVAPLSGRRFEGGFRPPLLVVSRSRGVALGEVRVHQRPANAALFYSPIESAKLARGWSLAPTSARRPVGWSGIWALSRYPATWRHRAPSVPPTDQGPTDGRLRTRISEAGVQKLLLRRRAAVSALLSGLVGA